MHLLFKSESKSKANHRNGLLIMSKCLSQSLWQHWEPWSQHDGQHIPPPSHSQEANLFRSLSARRNMKQSKNDSGISPSQSSSSSSSSVSSNELSVLLKQDPQNDFEVLDNTTNEILAEASSCWHPCKTWTINHRHFWWWGWRGGVISFLSGPIYLCYSLKYLLSLLRLRWRYYYSWRQKDLMWLSIVFVASLVEARDLESNSRVCSVARIPLLKDLQLAIE